MDGIWFLGFGLPLGILAWSSFSSSRKKLEKRIKKLEKATRGKSFMSQMLKEFIGKKPLIQIENSFGLSDYEVMEVDSDWMKLKRVDKKGQISTKVIRLDDIQSIELQEK